MRKLPARIAWHSKFLSQLLGQLRDYRGLSPKELAARASISEHTIATCERCCGNLSVDKIFKFIDGVDFEILVVFYEVEERLELAGKSSIPGKKHQRPNAFFKPLYDDGLLDPKETRKQLAIMKKLRKLSAK